MNDLIIPALMSILAVVGKHLFDLGLALLNTALEKMTFSGMGFALLIIGLCIQHFFLIR